MDFDHVLPKVDTGKKEYPVDAPERFASALQQFVWCMERNCESDAWDVAETQAANSQTSMKKVLSTSPQATHTLCERYTVL